MRGKVLSYMPAFQPYRGKPAVRNDREGRGNVGIIRSPIRASTLPDWPWIEQAAKRLHRNMLAIALANKLARIAWAVLARGHAYQLRITAHA